MISVFFSLLAIIRMAAGQCLQGYAGDGVCDKPCMTQEFGFDIGPMGVSDCADLCATHCPPELLSNSVCEPECNTWDCAWDRADCVSCSPGCPIALLSNGDCDLACYSAACSWDFPDCPISPVTVYVSPAGGWGSGRQESPYEDLGTALIGLFLPDNTVFLMPGEHLLFASGAGDLLSQRGLHTTTIQSWSDTASVRLTHSIALFRLSHMVTFENVHFIGEFDLKKDCWAATCLYCPYLAFDPETAAWRNDRNETVSISEYAEQRICDMYHSLVFITIAKSGTLVVNNTVFEGFRSQFNALISNECGVLHMSNVSFVRSMPAPQGLSGGLIQVNGSADSSPYYCGEVTFDTGNVSFLNFGYAYRPEIVLSGFMRLVQAAQLAIRSVIFEFNFAPIGHIVASEGDTSSALIYIHDIRLLTISDSVFRLCVGDRSGAVYLNSDFYYPLVIDGDNTASEEGLVHITVERCQFWNVTSQRGATLNLEYQSDHQNVYISQTYFGGNAASNAVISVVYSNSAPEDAEGMTRSVGGIPVFFPRRWVEMTQLQAERNACTHTIYIENVANVIISASTLLRNGQNDDVLSANLQAFVLPRLVFPYFPASVQCYSIIMLTNVLNLTLLMTNISYNVCSSGHSGVFLTGSVGNIDIRDNSFVKNQGSGALSLTIDVPIQLSGLTFSENSNRSNKKSACLDLNMEKFTDVTVTDSLFEGNFGWFSTVIYAGNVRTLRLDRVVVARNSAQYTCGGVLFSPNPQEISHILVKDSMFESNTAHSYGVLVVIDYEGLLAGNLIAKIDVQISACKFVDNKSETDGAAVSIGEYVDLTQESFIRDCIFTNNESEEGAAANIAFESGWLLIANTTFDRNTARDGAALYLHHEAGTRTGVNITNCRFLGQSGSYAVAIRGSASNNNVYSVSNLFVGGFGAYSLTSGSLHDQDSVYAGQQADTGGIAFAQTQSVLRFVRLTAENNTATSDGGVFFITSRSRISVSQGIVRNNTAIGYGGVLFLDEGSASVFRECMCERNQARGMGSVAFLSSGSVEISESNLVYNHAGDYACLMLSHCQANISQSRFSENTSGNDSPGLVLSSCLLSVSETRFSDQSGSLGVFLLSVDHNTILIVNSTFYRGAAELQGGAIYATIQSVLSLSQCVFESCSSTSDGGAVYIFGGTLTVDRSTFISVRGQSGSAVMATDTLVTVSESRFEDCVSGAIVVTESSAVTITGSVFVGSTTTGSGVLTLVNTQRAWISGTTFRNNTALSGGAVFLSSDGSSPSAPRHSFHSSAFFSNNATVSQGGGLLAINVDLLVEGCELSDNTARTQGGGLAVTCPDAPWCNVTIRGNQFNRNSAREGGGVYWSDSYPALGENGYTENRANYGADVASYPIRLAAVSLIGDMVEFTGYLRNVPIAIKVANIASGQPFPRSVKLGLFDHLNSLVKTDSTSAAQFIPLNSSLLTLSGNIDTQASEGVFTFSDFSMTGAPMSTQFVVVTTDGVKVAEHVKARDAAFTYVQTVMMQVEFRACVAGESQQKDVCFLCSAGTYSLDPSLPCLLCPSSALCYGNSTIVPKPGYWRMSNSTDQFIACLASDACLGSPAPPLLSPVGLCATGYEGNLCQNCVSDYSRTGRSQCSKCPSRASNIVISGLVVLIALVVIVVVVWTALKSALRPQSLFAIYVKIFMNYLQMVIVSASLDLNWPTFVKVFLSGQEAAGGMAEQLFSFDCLLQNTQLTTSSLYSDKLRIEAVVPGILFLLALAAWGAIAMATKGEQWGEKCVASLVIIEFVLHPTITKAMYSAFACMSLGDGRMWLISDLEVVCWDSTHISLLLNTVVPSLIVFVFGLPMLTLGLLIRRRHLLDTLRLKLMLCFLYKGYTRSRFYWEFVILYRKVALIAASVFLASVSIRVQALTVLAVLLISLYLQLQISPFLDPSLNRLEVKAVLISAVTIYSGMYYDTDEMSEALKVTLFAVIVAGNGYFLASWVRVVSPVIIRTLRERIMSLFQWRKAYKIRTMNRTLAQASDKPGISIDLSSSNVSRFSVIEGGGSGDHSVNPYSVPVGPVNTLVAMERECMERGEGAGEYVIEE